MSFEETIRHLLREELERSEDRIASRVAEKMRGESTPSTGGDRLLRLPEAQRLFGYAPETLRKWISDRKLTRFGTVRATRVSERELRALLAKRIEAKDKPMTDADVLELARARAARGR